MNPVENLQPVVVYFSEVGELRALLEETRAELLKRGTNKPVLTTTDGHLHPFELLPENFRVTDHLTTQREVRCKVCTHEPALRYEFAVRNIRGEWIGPVGSTCVFTQVLGKARAQSLGKKMQQHAIRESHNSRHRTLLARAGNHYTYLARLGLTWLHKPSTIKNFELPRKLEGQYRQAVQGGIIELELFEHLQQYLVEPKLPPAPRTEPHPPPPTQPSTTAPLKFRPPLPPSNARPTNLPWDAFQYWCDHQELLAQVTPTGMLHKINTLLEHRQKQRMPVDKVEMILKLIEQAKARSGDQPPTVPEDLWDFYVKNHTLLRKHLLPGQASFLKDEVARLERHISPRAVEMMVKFRQRAENPLRTTATNPQEQQEMDLHMQHFWQHTRRDLQHRFVERCKPGSRDHQLASEVLEVLEREGFSSWLLGQTQKKLMYIYEYYAQVRDDAHVHLPQLEHIHAALCRPESTEEEA